MCDVWCHAHRAAAEQVVWSCRRELLQRDEAVLRHLLQQELKKKESLKVAEAKVIKLREQLHASEKIVSANKTLLKKLQEQVNHERFGLHPPPRDT